MNQLTESQIYKYIKLAKQKTSLELNDNDWLTWNIREIVDGPDLDEAYDVGYKDASILNARIILDLIEIEY